MSKLNIGVGEEFPLEDGPKSDHTRMTCEEFARARRLHHGRRHHLHRGGGIAALLVLPLAAASVTTAIMFPLATLSVIGGLGLAGAAYRHSRRNSSAPGPQTPTPDDTDKAKDNS